MSGFLSGIKNALGFGGASQAAATDAAPAPATYPNNVPFDEGPCSGCADPCSHKQIPDYLKIDYEEPLLGSMKPYRRHILFQTPGQHWKNWVPKLDEAEGTLAAELSAAATAAGEQLGYRILVTAIDTQPADGGPSPCPWLAAEEALVLPDLVAVGPLTAENAKAALTEFMVTGKASAQGVSVRPLGPWQPAKPSAPTAEPTPTPAQSTQLPALGATTSETLVAAAEEVGAQKAEGAAAGAQGTGAGGSQAGAAEALPGDRGTDAGAGGASAAVQLSACVLVCAHKLRDKRCGVAGPMIMDELGAACRQRGIQNQVPILGCSHIGGHKFAGNVIVYSPQGGHWYGRVKPCHAGAIVDTHILGGRVLKELWRGRMEE